MIRFQLWPPQLHVFGRHVHHGVVGLLFALTDWRDWRDWIPALLHPGVRDE